jgi:hypothetical protein
MNKEANGIQSFAFLDFADDVNMIVVEVKYDDLIPYCLW